MLASSCPLMAVHHAEAMDSGPCEALQLAPFEALDGRLEVLLHPGLVVPVLSRGLDAAGLVAPRVQAL